MRRHFFARSILRAFGGLLDFAGPVKPYPVASAEEMTRAAWVGTGCAMRSAMRTVDGQLTDEQRKLFR